MKPIISPSLLSANFRHLGRELESIKTADWLHVDVMDGHFVRNLTYGYPIVKTLIDCSTPHPLDIHLMVSNPLEHVEPFAQSLSSQHGGVVTFHFEACDAQTIGMCLDALEPYPHVKKGIAIKPCTGPEVVLPWLERLDTVMVMTVEPGQGGQSFLTHRLDAIRRLRSLMDQRNPGCLLEVDGGIDVDTIALCAQAGADVFVAGTSIFKESDRAGAIAGLRGAIHG